MDNILKNHYYRIMKDNKLYAYINVKKDFYAEGILLENNTLLSGYFFGYKYFKAFILNKRNDIKNDLKAICIKSDEEKHYIDLKGRIILKNYKLYDAKMDEHCELISINEQEGNLEFKTIRNENTINDINKMIKSKIRTLNSEYKSFYKTIQKNRYDNLKELLNFSITYTRVDEKGTRVPQETIDDLKLTLKNLAIKNKKSENRK